VSPDPGDAAEKSDRERRDRPDDDLDASGELPVRQMDRLLIAGAEPPGEDPVSTITGTMTASMIAVASSRIVRSAAAIGPCGSSTPVCHGHAACITCP